VVNMLIVVFWDELTCGLVGDYNCFGGTDHSDFCFAFNLCDKNMFV
jgi:hypothetical protein